MYGRKETPIFELEVVLHRKYGGFSIDTEMFLWLIENRGWTIVKESQYDYKQKDNWPLNCLVEGSSNWHYHPNSESLAFRSQKDLIDCVVDLKLAHENDKYPESHYGHIHGLEVTKVKIFASIEDYNDGHERINCWSDFHEDN